MENYTTQKNAARKGIITKEMKKVAEEEKITIDFLIEQMNKGKIVIPANKYHKNLSAKGIGEGLRTKINVNLGVSEDCCNIEKEFEKVKKSIEMKTDSIMDLSCFGDTKSFRQKLIDYSTVMVGTVPIYDVIVKYGKNVKNITVDDIFDKVEEHAADGVDFMTIHAGLNRVALERVIKNKRLTNIVSRGGSIIASWMIENDKENPFYEYFDRLLEICKKYDVTISLGDGLRPGSINDATDIPQIQELLFLGELTKEAWVNDVQVMIEGPGHIPLNEIEANIKIEKKVCFGAPFYVLGPIVTDIAPGYDHITSAIGGTLAAVCGADFLCYVTPAEHLSLPEIEDIKEGIIASRIAAHAADICKNVKGALEWDYKMSEARKRLDWDSMIKLAIDPEKAILYREKSKPTNKEVCTMCGELCAVKRSNSFFVD